MEQAFNIVAAALAVYSVIWLLVFLRRRQAQLTLFAVVPSFAGILISNYAIGTAPDGGTIAGTITVVMCVFVFLAVPVVASKLFARAS